jgi:hypothetical protein
MPCLSPSTLGKRSAYFVGRLQAKQLGILAQVDIEQAGGGFNWANFFGDLDAFLVNRFKPRTDTRGIRITNPM